MHQLYLKTNKIKYRQTRSSAWFSTWKQKNTTVEPRLASHPTTSSFFIHHVPNMQWSK